MIQLPSCKACGGFIGLALVSCPHCGARLSRARAIAVGIAAAAGGSAVSMTLMACYGMSCVDANCGELPDASGDASDASSSDAAKDASADAVSDAGFDSASDAESDASSDAPSDASSDVTGD